MSRSKNLSMAPNNNSLFMFRLMVFIFGTTIAYSMLITTKVLELGYDLEVKGEGQIYLKYAIRLVKRTTISCLGAGRS